MVVPAADLTAPPASVDTEAEPADIEPDDGTVWEEGPIVVRLKEYQSDPLSVGQAVEAMELVGHDFYLFRDVASGAPSVIYRRRGFNYGLIRLEGEQND